MSDKQYTLLELEESLNEQQKRFCESRLFNNKVNAYMIAYPKCDYKSASASATRLLDDARIKQYTNLLKENIEDITGVSKIRNIAELAKIAYSSIGKYHNNWVDLKTYEDMTEEELAAIESIESETREDPLLGPVTKIKIKLHPKIAAIREINTMMPDYIAKEKKEVDHKGLQITYQNVSKQFPE